MKIMIKIALIILARIHVYKVYALLMYGKEVSKTIDFANQNFPFKEKIISYKMGA